MTELSDAYWDELGIAWCASDPDINIIASRLEARLRRHSRWITAGLMIGLPLGVAGVLLGLTTIWGGWLSGAWNFVTRGVAIVSVSAILTFAVALLAPVRSRAVTPALSEMIDLAIHRARKILSLIRAGLYASIIAAVFGLAGTAIRTHFAAPPLMSPVIDLVVLGLIALVLFLYSGQIRGELQKYRNLKHALAVDGDS
jgi:ABC-type multidrug transport system fused ATPase/permease subunit